MNDLEGMINGILSDPDQMKMIMNMAGQIMGSNGSDSTPISGSGNSEATPPLDNILSGLNGNSGGLSSVLQNLMGSSNSQNLLGDTNIAHKTDNKQALVDALKPWLSEKRCQKLDRAMMLAKVVSGAGVASLFKRGG